MGPDWNVAGKFPVRGQNGIQGQGKSRVLLGPWNALPAKQTAWLAHVRIFHDHGILKG